MSEQHSPDEVEGPVPGHYGDHQAETVWAPAHYATGPLEGPGRWIQIFAPIDLPHVGILYTDDDRILGYLPVSALNHSHPPAIASTVGIGLREAAALGRPATAVFDAWAARAGQGLAAGQITTGDLRELLG